MRDRIKHLRDKMLAFRIVRSLILSLGLTQGNSTSFSTYDLNYFHQSRAMSTTMLRLRKLIIFE
ncbi:hypothetical protein [Nostoc sp. NMS4]|uniref:hypothetical protein n=1 Tax=Nostoc sp. NMS4 TaxID=2815390 RepID=UPI0034176258